MASLKVYEPWWCWSSLAVLISNESIIPFLSRNDPESSNVVHCFNPAFVHAIAVPEVDMLDKFDKICFVARGDGVVDVINIKSDFSTAKSNGFRNREKVVNQDQMEGAFSTFGEKRRYIISRANDKAVKAWNWAVLVNWLCTIPTDSENLVVCDTSKVAKFYTVA
ncbi:uncharacterized protein LOC112526853 [Cynara cardunculus var. scolymus]|uniref:uncharacterized protein LOC112526853 n=1 Tax=Cynara cardunculus var. scolymus TaxID=59895 RepID=UPI000D62CBAF|nr:uncharacterized protein LOC112526853 [Cynara cardunculus var. scolymus]